MTREDFQKIWKLQGELFTLQRACIEYLTRFTPVEYIEDVNVRISNINDILNEIKQLETKGYDLDEGVVV